MADFNWDEFETAEPKDFDWDEFETAEASSKKQLPSKMFPPEIDAVVKGAARGFTLGFADEATAAIAALKDVVKQDRLSLFDTDDWKEAYKTNLKAIKTADKEAIEKHPNLAAAADFAASLAIPGGAALKTAKVGSRLSQAKSAAKAGAAIGGLEELGRQEELDLFKVVKSSIENALVGGAIGGALSRGKKAQKHLEDQKTEALKRISARDPSKEKIEKPTTLFLEGRRGLEEVPIARDDLVKERKVLQSLAKKQTPQEFKERVLANPNVSNQTKDLITKKVDELKFKGAEQPTLLTDAAELLELIPLVGTPVRHTLASPEKLERVRRYKKFLREQKAPAKLDEKLSTKIPSRAIFGKEAIEDRLEENEKLLKQFPNKGSRFK